MNIKHCIRMLFQKVTITYGEQQIEIGNTLLFR
jgi:hypothetical protein